MEIVIDIDEDVYEEIKKDVESKVNTFEHIPFLHEVIAVGTPLPKGHGRIMDVDKVIKKKREEQLKDDRSIWETAAVETALDMFGETIIEAEESESE